MGYISYEPMPEFNDKWNVADTLPAEGDTRNSNFTHNDIKRYAHNSREFIKRLTSEEHNSISYWTGAGSSVGATAVFNADNPWGIQCDDPEDDDYFDATNYMKHIDSALEKSDLPAPIIVYRGLSEGAVPKKVLDEKWGNDKTYTKEWIKENFVPGKDIEFKIPQSTSEDLSVADKFNRAGIIFEMKVSKAGAVGVTSAWGISEREYIVPRTTRYRIIGVQEKAKYDFGDYDDEYIVVQLEQIIDN